MYTMSYPGSYLREGVIFFLCWCQAGGVKWGIMQGNTVVWLSFEQSMGSQLLHVYEVQSVHVSHTVNFLNFIVPNCCGILHVQFFWYCHKPYARFTDFSQYSTQICHRSSCTALVSVCWQFLLVLRTLALVWIFSSVRCSCHCLVTGLSGRTMKPRRQARFLLAVLVFVSAVATAAGNI